MNNVKIKKISIHNFLSFEDEEWDFSNTSKLVLIKGVNKDTKSNLGNTSNGSGKSALSHALMYSLFGQLLGKIHISNLKNKYLDSIKDGWKMRVSIEVDTTKDNLTRHWRINRGLQKGAISANLQLLVFDSENNNWNDISKSTTALTQKFIEDNVLGMNFEMYQRIVMLSVEDKYNFFKLNAAQKRDFVETLLDTGVYSRMFKALNDDMKSKHLLMQNQKVTMVKLQKSKEVCENEIEIYKNSINDKIDEAKKEMDSKTSELDGFEPKFLDIGKKTEVLKNELHAIKQNREKITNAVNGLSDETRKLDKSISLNNATISHYQNEINKHKEVLEIICEDCKEKVNDFYSLDKYRKTIETLRKDIAEYESKIEGINGKKKKLSDADSVLKTKENEIASKISDLSVDERNLKYQKCMIENGIRDLEKRISDLEASISDNRKIPSWNVYENTLNELKNIDSEIKSEMEELAYMKIGVNIVSPDSIKKNIISGVVATINSMINHNLSELGAKFNCNLTCDMNDYEIQSSGGELDFPNLSLGEQMKLIISSQLAFRKFLSSRFNLSINVMIIDEVVDRALDSVSIQKLLEMLLQLSQKENINISIISHRSEVENMFNNIPEAQLMVVQKEENISRILKQ